MWVQSLGWEDLQEDGIATPYSCLENLMDREAWWTMAHKVTKSWTQLKQLSVHTLPPDSKDLPSNIQILIRVRRVALRRSSCEPPLAPRLSSCLSIHHGDPGTYDTNFQWIVTTGVTLSTHAVCR